MKMIPFYEEVLGCADSAAVQGYFFDNLKARLVKEDYFVPWAAVQASLKAARRELAALQPLVGSGAAFWQRLRAIVSETPSVWGFLAELLVTCGADEKIFYVLSDDSPRYVVDFTIPPSAEDSWRRHEDFLEKTGLAARLREGLPSHLESYYAGTKAGLGSHLRKNKGGQIMEGLLEKALYALCRGKDGWAYIPQATEKKIAAAWGADFSWNTEQKKTRYDFAVRTPHRLWLIEGNFYGSMGSKIKATAAEYSRRAATLRKAGLSFLWITDGGGWRTSTAVLEDAFGKMDHIVSLAMVERGILEPLLRHF